jgi:hypothetical protein
MDEILARFPRAPAREPPPSPVSPSPDASEVEIKKAISSILSEMELPKISIKDLRYIIMRYKIYESSPIDRLDHLNRLSKAMNDNRLPPLSSEDKIKLNELIDQYSVFESIKNYYLSKQSLPTIPHEITPNNLRRRKNYRRSTRKRRSTRRMH